MIAFCSQCGAKIDHIVPPGDHKVRACCSQCDFIDYQNPRIVTCAIVEKDGKILLAKRNIEPKFGMWTIPGGFMENGETIAESAVRETLEETEASCEIKQLIAIVNLPDYEQVHMFYTATMQGEHFAVTDESSEVALIDPKDIPWPDMAFRTVIRALEHYIEHKDQASTPLLETTIYANQVPLPKATGD